VLITLGLALFDCILSVEYKLGAGDSGLHAAILIIQYFVICLYADIVLDIMLECAFSEGAFYLTFLSVN
jgi:hypothetical protein